MPPRQRRPLVAAVIVAAVAVLMLPFRGGRDAPATLVSPVGTIGDDADATLTATARGIDTDATIVGITNLSVDGSSISIEGRLPDETASRTFSVQDGAFTLKGGDLVLNASILVRPNEVLFRAVTSGFSNMRAKGPVTLVAREVTSYRDGKQQTHRGSVSFVASGEATVRFGRQLGSQRPATVRWTDAPRTIRLRDADRSMTSWAGTGTVFAGGRTYTHGFGALAARGTSATLVRTRDAVKVSGRGRVQQIYLDGEPQFRTSASCDLVQIREETVAGRRIELTWAPRNTGDFDMLMTRIVPIGPAAGWLSFGLAGKPFEFGGEARPYRRGDTTGFSTGVPIRALLPPGDADRRDIGVFIPGGTRAGTYDASVRIEGNFGPVVVPFEVIVVAAQAPAG